jgi:hypothetical protein
MFLDAPAINRQSAVTMTVKAAFTPATLMNAERRTIMPPMRVAKPQSNGTTTAPVNRAFIAQSLPGCRSRPDITMEALTLVMHVAESTHRVCSFAAVN